MLIYKFGPFRIDSGDRLLTRDSEQISLPPLAIETLFALLDARGRVVKKEDFLRIVWHDAFVEEGVLTAKISQLRTVFKEAQGGDKYVATIHKVGYRWTGPLEIVAGQTTTPAEPPKLDLDPPAPVDKDGTPERVPPPILRSRWAAAAAALVVFMLFLWIVIPPSSNLHSLVVLPLIDTSADPTDGDYFALGMTDELLTNMAKISALKVVSYRTPGKVAADVAKDRNVEAALEGSVLRAGGRVRIAVRLIRARTGEQIWAESYEEDDADILKLQSKVAQMVARAIQAKVTPGDLDRLNSRSVQPEAYNAYLLGRFYWNKRTPGGFKEAVESFKRCIYLDPGYAPAYAGLADAYSLLGSTSYDALPPKVAMPKAKDAALMAVRKDERSAEAHASLAYILLSYDWDWAGSEREFQRAIQLNPGYATAHQWYSLYLLAQGRTQQALGEMKTALSSDPLSLAINTGVGWCLYQAKQFPQAIEQYRKALDLDGNFVLAHVMLGMAYERQKSYPEAIQTFQKALAIAPDSTFAMARLGQTYAVSGDIPKAKQVLERLGQVSKTRYVPATYPGAVYVALGEMDKAYQSAEQAYADRSHYVIYLNVEPSLDEFRRDSRFADFTRRIGWLQ